MLHLVRDFLKYTTLSKGKYLYNPSKKFDLNPWLLGYKTHALPLLHSHYLPRHWTQLKNKSMNGCEPGKTVMARWTTAAIGVTSSSTTAKLSPVDPYRSGDVKSGSNGSPVECIVTTVKLLASPAYLTWCLRGAPRVEKHVPWKVANCWSVWALLCRTIIVLSKIWQ